MVLHTYRVPYINIVTSKWINLSTQIIDYVCYYQLREPCAVSAYFTGTCTRFLENMSDSLHDIDFEKRYSIDDEGTQFLKGYGYALIGNPDHPDGTSTDHEYFFIHDKLVLHHLRNWPGFRYYIKGNSKRAIIFINQWQYYLFKIQVEK